MRRGVTLLELVLALALLAVLAAIALPAMLETSEHEKLKQAAEAIEEQLLLARAFAMTEGASVEVRYDPRKMCVQVCETSRAAEEHDEGDAPSESAVVKRYWAELAMSGDVVISTEQPEALAGAPETAPQLDAFSITALRMSAPVLEDSAEGEPITLALFLPDGSAPVVEPIWLSTEDGRAMRIDVGRWTGIPHINRTPAQDVAASPASQRRDSSDRTDVPARTQPDSSGRGAP